MKFKNLRDDLRLAGHGFIGALEEFEPVNVEGIVHQAYGEAPNFEPVDAEAKAAVADAQKPAEIDPDPAVAVPPTPPVPTPPVAPVVPPTTEPEK